MQNLVPLGTAGHFFTRAVPNTVGGEVGVPPGGGKMPTVPFTIRGISVSHALIDSLAGDVVIGHFNPAFDGPLSPQIVGQGTETLFFPSGFGVAFNPVTDFFDIHGHCEGKKGQHWVSFTIWYTVP